MRQEARLLKVIRESNATASLPDTSTFDLSRLEDERAEQQTAFGSESHHLKSYLAILLMRTMRDFVDTDSGVYKSHDAVGAIVEICMTDGLLRKRVRKQIRRLLDSPAWQYDSDVPQTWACVYCRIRIENDGEGLARVAHLRTHTKALPVEADEGFPFSKAHIRVARGHALGCLCGLVSADSWANHRQYFENELLTEDLTKLDVEIAASGRARTFFAEFSWDHDLPKGRGRTEVLKMRGLRPGPIKVITFD